MKERKRKRNLSSCIASKAHYGTFRFDLFKIKEQLLLLKIILFLDYLIPILGKVLPYSIMQKQLLANYFQCSAILLNAKNQLIFVCNQLRIIEYTL